MKKESRVHNLYLSHFQMASGAVSVDNVAGGWLNNRQTTYWNIDLKQILGSDWDKYDTFRITLKFLSHNFNTGTDFLCNTFISGLNFKNSSYECVSKNHTNRALMCSSLLPASNTSIAFGVQIHNYFSKGDAFVKFQMEHFKVVDGLPVSFTPFSFYVFEIRGVE